MIILLSFTFLSVDCWHFWSVFCPPLIQIQKAILITFRKSMSLWQVWWEYVCYEHRQYCQQFTVHFRNILMMTYLAKPKRSWCRFSKLLFLAAYGKCGCSLLQIYTSLYFMTCSKVFFFFFFFFKYFSMKAQSKSVVQLGNSGLYQIAFKGRWKLPQVRAIENFSMEKIFYWVIKIW